MSKRNKPGRKRIAKNAYKKQPGMMVYVKDWLNNAKLKRAGLDAEGLWARFMFQTHLTDDPKEYGVFMFSKLDESVSILLEHLLKQKYEQDFEFAANLLRVLLLQKHSFCSTFEDIIGATRDKFSLPLAKLLLAEVAKINVDGFLYSSRMVRDAELSEKRAKAGSKGGTATREKRANIIPDNPENNPDFAATFAVANRVANTAYANAYANTTPIYNKEGIERGSTEGENNNFAADIANAVPVPVMTVYLKTHDQLTKAGVKISETNFASWKQFVHYVATHPEYKSAFEIPKFVYPDSFEKLIAAGFTKAKWKPVIEKLCGLGFKPEQDLFLRIKDAMKWASTFAGAETIQPDPSGQPSEISLRINKTNLDVLEKSYSLQQITKEKYEFVKNILKPGVTLEQAMRSYAGNNSPPK